MYLPKAEILQMELVEPCCNLGIMYYLEHDQFQGQNETRVHQCTMQDG
jgi:hypothetical protein